MDVSVVIPIWGPAEYTDDCIKALNLFSPDVEIVAVDNTGKYELPVGPWFVNKLLVPGSNIGCGSAKALGAATSSGDVIITMDCDAFPHEGWLEPLVAVFDDERVGMAGPRILNRDGSLQTACIRTWHGIGHAGGENRRDEHASNKEELGATGACMAIRRTALQQCPFDTARFNTTYDDCDLSLQFKEAGWLIAYVAESTVTHGSVSTGPERWVGVHEVIANMNQKWGHR